MDTNPPPRAPPQAWLDALEEGEADRAAGRVIPWPAVRAALEDVLAAMERGADEAEQEHLLRVLGRAWGRHSRGRGPPAPGDDARRRAKSDVAALARDFRRKNRPGAIRNLLAALGQAMKQIAADPNSGLGAPRPHPGLAQPGKAWTKVGRYWFAYSLDAPPVITAVFYDAADIPGRV